VVDVLHGWDCIPLPRTQGHRKHRLPFYFTISINNFMKLFELKSTAEVIELEKQLDKMFATLGLDVQFTRHFIERILGRERDVTVQSILHSFDQLKRKYKSRLLGAKKNPGYSAVLRDFDQDLNIVFGIKPTASGHELTNITIKRKDPATFVTNTSGGDDLKVGSQN